MKSFGEKVRSLRKKQGLNQKMLAEVSGVSAATISRIESGKVEKVRPETLVSLASALGASAEYLTGKTTKITSGDLMKSDACFMDILSSYTKLSRKRREALREMANFLAMEEEQEVG
jgi:transcriptional regulator with XRE-family HTH domain